MNSKILPALPFLVVPLLALSHASAAHIDFIQDDSNPANGITNATFSLTTGGAAVSNTQMGEPADILGGTRTVTLERNGGFGGSVTASKTAGTTFIDFDTSNFLPTGKLTLDYAGINNANFISLWDAFVVELPKLENKFSAGDGELELTVTVESSAGNGSFTPVRFEDPGQFIIPFNSPGFSGVDFSDVDRVTFTFDTKIIGTVFQLESITRRNRVMASVPERGSAVAMLAISMTGLMLGKSRLFHQFRQR